MRPRRPSPTILTFFRPGRSSHRQHIPRPISGAHARDTDPRPVATAESARVIRRLRRVERRRCAGRQGQPRGDDPPASDAVHLAGARLLLLARAAPSLRRPVRAAPTTAAMDHHRHLCPAHDRRRQPQHRHPSLHPGRQPPLYILRLRHTQETLADQVRRRAGVLRLRVARARRARWIDGHGIIIVILVAQRPPHPPRRRHRVRELHDRLADRHHAIPHRRPARRAAILPHPVAHMAPRATDLHPAVRRTAADGEAREKTLCVCTSPGNSATPFGNAVAIAIRGGVFRVAGIGVVCRRQRGDVLHVLVQWIRVGAGAGERTEIHVVRMGILYEFCVYSLDATYLFL